MRRTFSYKADANKITTLKCLNCIEYCRQLYNAALEQRITLWTHRKKSLTYIDQTYEMKYLRMEIPQYAEINSQILQDPLKRVDLAFKGFYRRNDCGSKKVGYPKFKAKGRYRSVILKNTGWSLKDKYLDVKNIGRFKLFLSRPIEGNIRTVTIRRTMTNKWYVSFSCDSVPNKFIQSKNNEVIIRNDTSLTYPQNMIKYVERLKQLQEKIQSKELGSNRRAKARLQIEKLYEKIVNIRKDFIHKNTTNLIKNNNAINIVDTKNTSAPLIELGWYMLKEILDYKASECGTVINSIDNKNTKIEQVRNKMGVSNEKN